MIRLFKKREDQDEKLLKNIERYESIIKISKNDVSKLHDLSWQKQELNLINVYRRLREDFDISS